MRPYICDRGGQMGNLVIKGAAAGLAIVGAVLPCPGAAVQCDFSMLEPEPAERFVDRTPALTAEAPDDAGWAAHATPLFWETDEPADRIFRVARAGLRRAGAPAEAVLGAMTAVPPNRAQSPSGAWLVTTEVGEWWVWACGAVVRVDETPRLG